MRIGSSRKMPANVRLVVAVLVVLLLVALGLFGWLVAHRPAPDAGGRAGVAGVTASAAFDPYPVGFSLRDIEGRRRTLADFGRPWKLVYFGYTYCPDVCPTELAKMARALSLLARRDESLARTVVPVFVTVDPERDTPARLAEYLVGFDDDFVGLTGTPAEIAAAARSFGIHYARVPGSGDGTSDYLMEHASLIFLVDREGRVVEIFTARETPADLAESLHRRIAGGTGGKSRR